MSAAESLTSSLHEQGYAGPEQLGEALKGADVIIIPAGVPRKPGMTRDDLFKVGALLQNLGCCTLRTAQLVPGYRRPKRG